MHRSWIVAASLAVTAMSSPAHAWQIESIATTGCHERITVNALERIGFPDGATPPSTSDYDSRVIADVPFSFPGNKKDGWRVALLIGVRDNDVGKYDPTDVAALSVIHNDPERQDEHCLRHREDDNLEGNAAAKARCKAFILEQLELALGDDATLIDMTATASVEVNLKFRNRIRLHVNRFAYHTGRALHALQDSYTHMFRDPETGHIRTVLNWIEGNIGNSYVEDRDGHEHIGGIDDCTRTDAESRTREEHAETASALLLEAIADGTGGREGRLARASKVLDDAFVEVPDCTLANDYCGANELTITGCNVGGTTGLATFGLVGIAGLLVVRRRRRGAAIAATSFALGLLVFAPRTASADVTEAPKSDAVEEKQLEREDKVIEALPDPTTQTWGMAFGLGAAIDRGAAAVSLGVRYNSSKSFGTGIDIEYNPWLSYSELDVVAGAINVYVPLIWKLRSFGSWELRSTFAVGASMLLTDLVEGDRGSIGAYAGWNPLGVAVTVSPNWKLLIKPGDIAVPVPVLTGFPFYYHQYRFSVGFEWYP